jgi:hypothetical protein
MLGVVEPELDAIDSYLDNLQEDPPSAAVANLAKLTEAAIEVRITLARREAEGTPTSSLL